MKSGNVIVVLSLSLILSCHGSFVEGRRREFPQDFIFGAATSAYQTEGAWDVDGKTPSLWDYHTHTYPDSISDQSNGDIAADSYHHYLRDVEMLRELGVQSYRLSISWTRLLPTGFTNKVNPAGVEYYSKFIDELLKYNITPLVTIFHWDVPQNLQQLGGLTNPLFVDWFEDYARVVFELFGDRVKFWITINEPKQICLFGYGSTRLAPQLNAGGVADYICAKTILLANARAYHLYNEEFRSKQGGQVGLAVDVPWYSPHTDTNEDEFATELQRQFDWALYTDPIFSDSRGWPAEFSERILNKSLSQGFPRSRLPPLSREEAEYIHGTGDFLGVNHYVSNRVSASKFLKEHAVPSTYDDANVGTSVPDDEEGWTVSEFGIMPLKLNLLLQQGPNNLYHVLSQLSCRYTTRYYITESGVPTGPGLNDTYRVTAYRNNLESVLNAIDEGIPIKGFYAWSLMDNFEWLSGYTRRFGLYDVDFTDPARPRTAKHSAFVYKHIVTHRHIDHEYDPAGRTMSID
ncbi:myrosinase 1-like [Plutella xylostella]|uniref:myrosinase 1-like n=1 Tax=Plutella xylostella TaxID=51655 RepID=UPI00203278E4|nr:myrosinase 1-like [Plutella xylostella]